MKGWFLPVIQEKIMHHSFMGMFESLRSKLEGDDRKVSCYEREQQWNNHTTSFLSPPSNPLQNVTQYFHYHLMSCPGRCQTRIQRIRKRHQRCGSGTGIISRGWYKRCQKIILRGDDESFLWPPPLFILFMKKYHSSEVVLSEWAEQLYCVEIDKIVTESIVS